MSKHTNSLPAPANLPSRLPYQPCGGLAVQPCRTSPVPITSGSPIPPAVQNTPVSAPPTPTPSARCSVKGCVFPAPLHAHPMCHYHELLQSDAEAEHFQSHQPTRLLSLRAPFGIPDEEPDDSRLRERRRQAAEREAFLLDEAA